MESRRVRDGPNFRCQDDYGGAATLLRAQAVHLGGTRPPGLAGIFSGLGEDPAGAASLLVSGAAGEHRLRADADSTPPADREQWAASFTWQEPPVAFEAARLELDGGLRVELPPPGARRGPRRRVFEVHGPDDDAGQDAPAESPIEALRLQAALLTAEEQRARNTPRRSKPGQARPRAAGSRGRAGGPRGRCRALP